MGTPLKISLLTALPHSLADVEAAADDPRKDYVVNQLLKYYPPKEIWRFIGPHLEVAAEKLFSWCNENHIDVVRKATRLKLEAAARVSDIVIVFAHWKGASVRWTDITAPVARLEPCIRACRSARILGPAKVRYASNVSEDESRATLAKCLTVAVRRWPKWLDLNLATKSKDYNLQFLRSQPGSRKSRRNIQGQYTAGSSHRAGRWVMAAD